MRTDFFLPMLLIAFVFLKTGSAVAGSNIRFQFPLHLYVNAQAGWTEQQVSDQLQRVQEIYQQCQMRAEPIFIHSFTEPQNLQNDGLPMDQKIILQFPREARPAVFLTGGEDTPQAFGDEFAPGSPREALTWTAWISRVITNDRVLKAQPEGYSTMAHELAHVLCNCGHTEGTEKNLLAGDIKYLSPHLTTQQCEAFQKSSFVQEIKP